MSCPLKLTELPTLMPIDDDDDDDDDAGGGGDVLV